MAIRLHGSARTTQLSRAELQLATGSLSCRRSRKHRPKLLEFFQTLANMEAITSSASVSPTTSIRA